MTLQQIGDAAVIYCATIATASVVVHATVRRPAWWSNAWGSHLMAYMAAVAWILDLAAARVIAGATLDTPWYAAVRAGSFALLIPAVLTWRLFIQCLARGWLPWQRRRAARLAVVPAAAPAARRLPDSERPEPPPGPWGDAERSWTEPPANP